MLTKIIKVILSLGSLILIFYFFKNFYKYILLINPSIFLLSLLIYALSYIPWALRTYFISKDFSFTYYLKVHILGLYFNQIFPGRLGEGVRVLFLSKKGLKEGLRIVLFDRLNDIIILFSLFFFFLISKNLVITVILTFIISSLFYFPFFKLRAIPISFFGLLIWILETLTFHIFYKKDFSHSLFIISSANIFSILPSLPGHIGVFEVGLVFASEFLGLNTEEILGYGILTHIVHYLAAIILGLTALKFVEEKEILENKEKLRKLSNKLFSFARSFFRKFFPI